MKEISPPHFPAVAPRFMVPQSSWYPKVHGTPRFMVPQGSWYPKVHGTPRFMVHQDSWYSKVHGTPRPTEIPKCVAVNQRHLPPRQTRSDSSPKQPRLSRVLSFKSLYAV
ncbi:hypothetical protein BgiBS90_003059 [Biomphalaria glabrata]|nr:hypothetical protein BgiBS90_003059 [Biomphalaria glabrata]